MNLKQQVTAHRGQFICVQIHNESNCKQIAFHHVASEPYALAIPDVPGLQEFYELFGSLELYKDCQSGDSAFYVASPEQWQTLGEEFGAWIDGLDQDEKREYLPEWIDDRVVLGEIPASGNYLLTPTHGSDAGKVFLFDHDGFEFNELAPSLCNFVRAALAPDPAALASMASHMRFISDESTCQWWITELRDIDGRVVRTAA